MGKTINIDFGKFKKKKKAHSDSNVWEEAAHKPIGNTAVRIILSLFITIVIGAIYFYAELPALNIHAMEFYVFVFILCAVYAICMIVLGGIKAENPRGYANYVKKSLKLPLTIVGILAAVIVVGIVIGLPLFRASSYAKLLDTETGDFAADVEEISFDQIPMLDSSSANNLANRKLGELSDLVSQFNVSESSAQINYKGAPVRVTYLNYDSFFKWWKNQSAGIPAYMIIDMSTQDVKVVRLENGIKYSPSEWFNRNLMRQLRFNYPTCIFNDVNFEIDEEGVPYWVASVTEKRIGLFNGDDIKGAVLMNAETGESKYYDVADVPTWVDRVYSSSLVINQYNYYGLYVNGFFNSFFGQTNCTVTTDGYNYIAMDDDVWMYTGITSVSGDRGNIGFLLVNQRTKDSRYYSCAGAEEYSAMSSAQGAVQQYSYDATFPLLLNIADEPTYFMALKDTGGLVKMYAMVNVQQYQIVATGSTVQACQASYKSLLVEKNILTEDEVGEELVTAESLYSVTGKITEIRSANMDGDTYYFFKLDNKDNYYTINAKDYPLAVILNVDDNVTIGYSGEAAQIMPADSIELK